MIMIIYLKLIWTIFSLRYIVSSCGFMYLSAWSAFCTRAIHQQERLSGYQIWMNLGRGAGGLSPVQSLSHVRLFAIPWTAALQASLSFTISWSLLKLMCIESLIPSNYLILCHHLLLLPSLFPSLRVFSSMKSALHIRWPKYWSFIFSTSPSNEYSGLISFRIDWFDGLSVQGTLKSLLQHWALGLNNAFKMFN